MNFTFDYQVYFGLLWRHHHYQAQLRSTSYLFHHQKQPHHWIPLSWANSLHWGGRQSQRFPQSSSHLRLRWWFERCSYRRSGRTPFSCRLGITTSWYYSYNWYKHSSPEKTLTNEYNVSHEPESESTSDHRHPLKAPQFYPFRFPLATWSNREWT